MPDNFVTGNSATLCSVQELRTNERQHVPLPQLGVGQPGFMTNLKGMLKHEHKRNTQ